MPAGEERAERFTGTAAYLGLCDLSTPLIMLMCCFLIWWLFVLEWKEVKQAGFIGLSWRAGGHRVQWQFPIKYAGLEGTPSPS